MSKIHQRTQPLSCSRHKRNGCRAQAQAALPTMMSGLDGCLRADVTWVGSGQKGGESFHVCFSAAQCWRRTVAEQGSTWSASIWYITLSPIYMVYDTITASVTGQVTKPTLLPSPRGPPQALPQLSRGQIGT